jgi:hypothetical protein
MKWDPSLAEREPLAVSRLGFLQGELRLYFRPLGVEGPAFVLQLEQVASFYDRLPRGMPVRITDHPEHGSFGWWLPAGDKHRSIQVSSIGSETGFFLALARRTVYHHADESEASNWPG